MSKEDTVKSLHDINGEDIKEGDFCLFCSNNGGMNYGMLCGKSYVNRNGILEYFSNAYKLDDEYLKPAEKEYKKEVQKRYVTHCNKLKTRKSVKRVNLKDMEVGRIYAAINGDSYIFYGHGTVTTYTYGHEPEVETGLIYLYAGDVFFKSKTDFTITDEDLNKYLLCDMDLSSMPGTPIVLKTAKKLVAKTSYISKIITKEFEYCYRDEYSKWRDNHPSKNNRKRIRFVLD